MKPKPRPRDRLDVAVQRAGAAAAQHAQARLARYAAASARAARLQEKIAAAQRRGPADPELPELRRQLLDEVERGRDAVCDWAAANFDRALDHLALAAVRVAQTCALAHRALPAGFGSGPLRYFAADRAALPELVSSGGELSLSPDALAPLAEQR